ncbi:MAG: 60S ribosomal protein L34 [Candidatus Heimdallarchaeota archaeon]|nr:60S ribosomal protein L34 [Candidatus Heimdallarchaeota archaeon]MDH5647219.1 60S ribosomal protein L34 [Candidatus Heimdallarchaeota archaeon]
MVRKSVRSGKRRLVKTPGGRFYFKKIVSKPNYHHCATCSRKLPGMPRGTTVEIRRLPVSKRSPNRPYGGQLCSPCLKRKLITASRTS